MPEKSAALQVLEELDRRARTAADVLRDAEASMPRSTGVLERLAAAPMTARSMLAGLYEQESTDGR